MSGAIVLRCADSVKMGFARGTSQQGVRDTWKCPGHLLPGCDGTAFWYPAVRRLVCSRGRCGWCGDRHVTKDLPA